MIEKPQPHILITGSTDGIGKQTALELLQSGANVVLHGRSEDKLYETQEEFQEILGIKSIETVLGDFSSLNSVRAMADKIRARFNHLEVLINNVGTYESTRRITIDGFESTFQVNYLAPFLLTIRLLPLLLNGSPSRIVNVASRAHAKDLDFDNLQGEKTFTGYGAYAASKLCNIIFTAKLAEILRNCYVSVNCLHPGVIDTKLLRRGFGAIGRPVEEGAKRVLYVAMSPNVGNKTGQYFVDSHPSARPVIVNDTLIQSKLWNISQQLSGESYRESCEQEQKSRLIDSLHVPPIKEAHRETYFALPKMPFTHS